jgi:hypothetical protein
MRSYGESETELSFEFSWSKAAPSLSHQDEEGSKHFPPMFDPGVLGDDAQRRTNVAVRTCGMRFEKPQMFGKIIIKCEKPSAN